MIFAPEDVAKIQQAGSNIALWREHPAQMVVDLFGATPDPWQAEDLEAFPHTQRYAAKACKGPGKSTLLAWMGWNFMLTRPHPNCAAISITADNLKDGLWKEMAKWYHRSKLVQELFEVQAERIFARGSKDTWFMSARSWSQSANKEQQANALAGFHADRLLYLVDESGGIPDAVMIAAEAALSSGIECKIAQAGNPTHLEGPLYRACTVEADIWRVREITADPDDPMRTPRVSIEWARQMIKTHGADNPWVLVNVFGRFPPSSLNALIGPDEIQDAMKRHYPESAYSSSAKVLGADVALYGDDEYVLAPRQGIAAFAPIRRRAVGPTQWAGQIANKWRDWKADACFVDATGGFGDPVAALLHDMNFNAQRVLFNDPANDPRYFNRRTEMYFEFINAIKAGLALPNLPEFVQELPATTYSFKGDRLLLIPKQMVKEKIGHSPDVSDAYALTYAAPVLPAWRQERSLLEAMVAESQRAVTRDDGSTYNTGGRGGGSRGLGGSRKR